MKAEVAPFTLVYLAAISFLVPKAIAQGSVGDSPGQGAPSPLEARLNSELSEAMKANRNGNYAEAQKILLQAIPIAPRSPVLWLELGDAQAGLKKDDLAIAFYDKSIALDPTAAMPYSRKMQVLCLNHTTRDPATNKRIAPPACVKASQEYAKHSLPGPPAEYAKQLADSLISSDSLEGRQSGEDDPASSAQCGPLDVSRFVLVSSRYLQQSDQREGAAAFCERPVAADFWNKTKDSVVCTLAFHHGGQFTRHGGILSIKPGEQGDVSNDHLGATTCNADSSAVRYFCYVDSSNGGGVSPGGACAARAQKKWPPTN